ncbi:ABC transporter permease [Pseudochelatococcus sp. B33]
MLVQDMTSERPKNRKQRRFRLSPALAGLAGSRSVVFGGGVVTLFFLCAVLAPVLFTVDPVAINPIQRMRPPSELAWFGTDALGRDVYSRVIFGIRTSLIVGLAVVVLSTVVGLFLGLVSGYVRALDPIIMRIMDGLMAIPAILLAIGLVAVTGANLGTVLAAITVPEVPRIVRLVRGVVLSIREEPYVEAAIASGTRVPVILWRHILPSTIAPLLVMSSYVACHAIIAEAVLSFLGAGLPPEIPSLGNTIAEGRRFLQIQPHLVFIPSLVLSVIVLGVNVLGDGLRDQFDPRMKRRP